MTANKFNRTKKQQEYLMSDWLMEARDNFRARGIRPNSMDLLRLVQIIRRRRTA